MSNENNEKNNQSNNFCLKANSFLDDKRILEETNLSNRKFPNSFYHSSKSILTYYEINNRLLTSNFAGGEDKDNDDEIGDNLIEPVFDRTETFRTLSRKQYLNQKGELEFWPTLFTFIKVNIVAGFLFLPAGFKNGGWLFSIITIFSVSLLTIYCNICISDCTDAANTYSLSKIGKKAGGKVGYYFVEIGIAISQICFPCSYANLITQTVNNMINLWFDNKEDYFIPIALVLGIILIPMCLVRNISKFSSMHLLGDIAVLATVVSLAYESIRKITSDSNFNINNFVLFNSGWSKLLGMSITSLEGIGVILPIKESMKDKSKFNWVIIIGTFVISLILTGFPLIMYFCYQDKVDEIVLNNLPLDKIYIQVILILLMFSVLTVYPVTLYPAFVILKNIFFKKNDNNISKTDCITTTIYENFLRTFIVIITITIGVYSIGRFDTLLALCGCAICTPVALILPSIFHFLLFKNNQSSFRNFLDITVAILGCSLSLSVLIFTII
jgi:proton-coupled amino acid transporter